LAVHNDLQQLKSHAVFHSTFCSIPTQSIFELFFVKKVPLSRRVEYVMETSMDEWVSESVSETYMYVYYKQSIKFLVVKVNGM